MNSRVGVSNKGFIIPLLCLSLFLPTSLSLDGKPNSIVDNLLLNDYNRGKAVVNMVHHSVTKARNIVEAVYRSSVYASLEQMEILKVMLLKLQNVSFRNKYRPPEKMSGKRPALSNWLVPDFSDTPVYKKRQQMKQTAPTQSSVNDQKAKLPKPRVKPRWDFSKILSYLAMPVPLYWVIVSLPFSILICVVFAHTVLRQDIQRFVGEPFDFFRYEPAIKNKVKTGQSIRRKGPVEIGSEYIEVQIKNREKLQGNATDLKSPLSEQLKVEKNDSKRATRTSSKTSIKRPKQYAFRGKKIRNLMKPVSSDKDCDQDKTLDEDGLGDCPFPVLAVSHRIENIKQEPEAGSIANRLRSGYNPTTFD